MTFYIALPINARANDFFSCCRFVAEWVTFWPQGYKTFFMLNSTEHEIFLLINVKMPTTVGILTFLSGNNSILGLSEPEKAEFPDIFIFMSLLKFHAQLN